MTALDLSQPSKLRFSDIWKAPMPRQQEFMTRFVIKSVMYFCRNKLVSVEGPLQHLESDQPIIVALNHNQRLETLIVEAALFMIREGRPIHFLADWNFMLVPFVASLYRRAETIIVTSKDNKIKPLNYLKPYYAKSSFERALEKLSIGGAIGFFPEGTMNRDPNRLMYGRSGAVHLSIQSGVPILPIGIRFPYHDGVSPIQDSEPMSLCIGEPIKPPQLPSQKQSHETVEAYHEELMHAIGQLCGKTWSRDANKRRRYV